MRTTIIIAIFFSCLARAQNKYVDRNGVVVFEASEALFEPVRARCESSTVIFNEADNRIAALLLMRGFEFKNPLMQEHFNENYIESDLYPKAIFSGNLAGFNIDDTKIQERKLTGYLEIRGLKKEISPIVKIQKVDDVLLIEGRFLTYPSDFDIKIPKIVQNKIAKEVEVTFDFKLKRQ